MEPTMNSHVVMLVLRVLECLWCFRAQYQEIPEKRKDSSTKFFCFNAEDVMVSVLMKMCMKSKKNVPHLSSLSPVARSGQRCYAYPKDKSTCRGVGIDGSRGWHVWRKVAWAYQPFGKPRWLVEKFLYFRSNYSDLTRPQLKRPLFGREITLIQGNLGRWNIILYFGQILWLGNRRFSCRKSYTWWQS